MAGWHPDCYQRATAYVVEFRFAFRWIALDEAARVLWPSQSMWIDSLRVSARSAP